MNRKDFLQIPIQPFEVDGNSSVAQVLEKMQGISFQGRTLAQAYFVWKEMLKGETVILMGLAGAMVPAGMRRILVFLIENRFIDCLVSTGANLFHDCHEILGNHHYRGDPNLDDTELRRQNIDRIYDTLADDLEFQQVDQVIVDFARSLKRNRSYTTREFFSLFGEKLKSLSKEKGILTAAAEHGVPIYCPAIGDSSYGIALSLMDPEKFEIVFNVIADVRETAAMVANAKQTGIIFIGGGTPKNFIQQSEITAQLLGWKAPGHHFAIQLTTDAPQWGGLSGCTFSESHSWGKIYKHAPKVAVYVDATIALPILATALAEEKEELLKRRKIPQLQFS